MWTSFAINPSVVGIALFATFCAGLLLGYLGRPTRESIMEDHISNEALNNILRLEGRKGCW